MADSRFDNNFRNTVILVSEVDGETPINHKADPNTGAALVKQVDSSGNIVSGPLDAYSPCFVDKAAPITYISVEDEVGNWAIMKLDKTSGTVITYANESNNPSYTDVTTARTNRASLTYQLPSEAF